MCQHFLGLWSTIGSLLSILDTESTQRSKYGSLGLDLTIFTDFNTLRPYLTFTRRKPAADDRPWRVMFTTWGLSNDPEDWVLLPEIRCRRLTFRATVINISVCMFINLRSQFGLSTNTWLITIDLLWHQMIAPTLQCLLSYLSIYTFFCTSV